MDTTFFLGNADAAWDGVADMIQGFGAEDTLDLSRLGITADSLSASADGKSLLLTDTAEVIAEFSNFQNELTIDQLLLEGSGNIYYGA